MRGAVMRFTAKGCSRGSQPDRLVCFVFLSLTPVLCCCTGPTCCAAVLWGNDHFL